MSRRLLICVESDSFSHNSGVSDMTEKPIISNFIHRSAASVDVSEIGKSAMTTRNIAMTAAVAAAAALAATGVTYASAAGAPEAAPAVRQAAPAAAPAVAGPAAAPLGGDSGNSKGNEGQEEGRREGRIDINERTYTAHFQGCITVLSGLGSKSFNIRNDSRKTVEFFRGVTCDNGAPIATVGPWSTSNGVKVDHDHGRGHGGSGVHVRDGVVGSFRVVDDHRDGRDDGRGGY